MSYLRTAGGRRAVRAKGNVLDASAVIAVLQEEPGTEKVRPLMESAVISAVNIAEILAKLIAKGMPAQLALDAVESLDLEVIPFGAAEARASTGFVHKKLSLGGRACLATAYVRGDSAITGDREWKTIQRAIDVVLIR
jgi:ribonuclease VapC